MICVKQLVSHYVSARVNEVLHKDVFDAASNPKCQVFLLERYCMLNILVVVKQYCNVNSVLHMAWTLDQQHMLYMELMPSYK